jgi:hypothetical protein
MGELHETARHIITRMMKMKKNRGEVAAIYGIPPDLVDWYLRGKDCGTLHAREVIRVEIARRRAELRGETHFRPRPEDRYKGTRYL